MRSISTWQKVNDAPSQKAALLALAAGIDNLADQVAKVQPPDDWSDGTDYNGPVAEAIRVEKWGPPPQDTEIVARLRSRIAFETDADELRALKAQLELLTDPGEAPAEPDQGRRVEATEDEVIIPAVSSSRQGERRAWARATKLWEYIPLDDAEAIDAFGHGGPMWLYHYDRDAVLALPLDARQWLVNEAERDSAPEAAELARDILMDRSTSAD